MNDYPMPEALIGKIDGAVKELNGKREPSRPVREMPPFVNLSEQLAASILESAQQALTEAENNMNQAQAYAEKLRAEIKQRAESLSDLTKRIEEFGHTVLTAHERFHGLEGPKENFPERQQ